MSRRICDREGQRHRRAIELRGRQGKEKSAGVGGSLSASFARDPSTVQRAELLRIDGGRDSAELQAPRCGCAGNLRRVQVMTAARDAAGTPGRRMKKGSTATTLAEQKCRHADNSSRTLGLEATFK